MKATTGKSRPFLKAILWVLGVLLTLLLVGELALTLMGWRHRAVPQLLRARADSTQREGGRLAFHPSRLFTVAPNHRLSLSHAGRQATGDWPFRGRPLEPASDQLLRVILLGDSATHGVQLFTRDSLAACLTRELDRRGLPPERVAVINLGVPGYTTLQVERLVLEELAGVDAPVAVVLSTALWNDRAAASTPITQADLMGAATPGIFGRVFSAWTACIDWVAWGGDPLRAFASPEEINAAWRAGAPLYGPLVSRDSAAAAMLRTIDALQGRSGKGGTTKVIATLPAHPFRSLGEQIGLMEDVATLRSAYTACEASIIDGPELLALSGLKDTEAFLDDVHPSGLWNAVLARAIADELELKLREDLANVQGQQTSLEILGVKPEVLSPLGDQTLEVRVSGLAQGTLPIVLVGGQPLLDLVRVDDELGSILSGRTAADRPGSYDVLVQSSAGTVRRPTALRREAPRLEYAQGDKNRFGRLVLYSRPGDRLLALWSAGSLAEESVWSLDGDILLGSGAEPVEIEAIACDANGRSEIRLLLPEAWPARPTFLQGIVLPPGQSYAPGIGVASIAVRVPAKGPAASASTEKSTAPAGGH